MADSSMTPDVYYRIHVRTSGDGAGICVVTMQNFDEYDYDQTELLPIQFETKLDAEMWMNRIIIAARS